MRCPKCKSKASVVDGCFNHEYEEYYRKCVCPTCGHKFYTVEFPVEDNERLKDEWSDARKEYLDHLKESKE